MEIFNLLETIEDMLENSKTLPFTNKAVLDKEELLDIIKEIRLKLPEELKQAKVIKEEHDRIIEKANEEAQDIVKEAENRIISMIADNILAGVQVTLEDALKVIQNNRKEVK